MGEIEERKEDQKHLPGAHNLCQQQNHAAMLKDAGLPYGREAAIAKLFGSEIGSRCADRAIQVLGGYGYTRDYPVERIYRDNGWQ